MEGGVAVREFGAECRADLVQHLVSPPNSHGKLGGKSSGLFLASHIVRRSDEYADALSQVKVPKTWYITSDGLMDFVEYNHLEDVYNRKYLEVDQIRREYPHIVQVFKNSTFPPEMVKGLSAILDSQGLHEFIFQPFIPEHIDPVVHNRGSSVSVADLGDLPRQLRSLLRPRPQEPRLCRGAVPPRPQVSRPVRGVGSRDRERDEPSHP